MLNQLEIVGQEISTETNFNSQSVRTVEEAESFANKIGFPSHGLVVMLSSDSLERTEIFKGINTEEKLTEIVTFALNKSSTGKCISKQICGRYIIQLECRILLKLLEI